MKTAGTGRGDGSMGLAGLLQAGDGALAGLSGDLQALLMQLSPQLLQRLDDLLAGGMDLPQAASALLGETAGAFGDGLFADFLQQRLPLTDEGLAPGAASRPAVDGAPLGPVLQGLEASAPLARDLAAAGAALAAVAALQAPAQGPNAAQFPPQIASSLLDMGVPQQVGGKGWDGAIADRVMWMVQGEQQFARLKLNPPHLGPLEVRLSLSQDQASVSFIAQHAAVREALEAALPRLREMFDQQSLQLVRTDIADPGAQQRGDTQDSTRQAASRHDLWGGDSADDPRSEGTVSAHPAVKGLIDLFA